jgi:hypothetical protein
MKAGHFLLRRSSGFARVDMVLLVFLAIAACGPRFAQRGDRVRRRPGRLGATEPGTGRLGLPAGGADMMLGAIAAVLCRPDLKANTLTGGALFFGSYTIFLLGLKWLAPGYIEQVWNLRTLSSVIIYGLLLEELLFEFSFGLVWTGIYEHFTSKRSVAG